MQACVIEGNFPPHCAPGGTGKHIAHAGQPPPKQTAPPSAAPSSATLCHMLPCCFPRRSGADGGWGREGENNCGHGWQTPLIRLPPNHPASTRRIVRLSTCAHLDALRMALMTTACVNMASRWASHVLLRLPDPATGDKPIKQPISMMAATLI